jgi:glycosyltransferase involved in cell wall biosynthesis
VPEWHLVTAEFPPQRGGVSDYTLSVAEGLARAGDRVHVWCPPAPGATSAAEAEGVVVHRELGGIAPADLRRVGEALDSFAAPRRLLVQWVPHAYGFRSMNLPFCLWLRDRAARHGDRVEIMVHEPSLAFVRGGWKQNAAAAVHRIMTVLLLRAAERVWVSTPAWEARWRPWLLGRSIPFGWLPIPSSVPVVDDPEGVAAVRARYAPGGERIVGHFGTYRPAVHALLARTLEPALARSPQRVALLLGRGGERLRDELLGRAPGLEGRIHATGGLPAPELSCHLSACDVLLQPFPDGVNGRQSSMAAALAHGCAAVTTEGENSEPVWRESAAVALAPVGDVPAAVGRVEELLGDAEARARLGAAARSLYESRLALRHTIAALRAAPR